MTLLPLAALVALAADPAPASATENPWVDGPQAPPPDEAAPIPTAPREPGATVDPLDVPPRPPEPVRRPLELRLLPSAAELRLSTERFREQSLDAAALDLDGALIGVPGLWLIHEQAGVARMQARGLSERRVAVLLDGVPLFDLAGLLPPLEQLSVPGSARLTFAHGARATTALGGVPAGVLAVDTGASPRELGESLRLDGALAAGYGGPDLEKGALAYVEGGLFRARAGAHAALLNREDQRRGRAPSEAEPGAVLVRSGGSGGAVGARVDVAPLSGLRVFSSWHSARAFVVPRPPGCADSNAQGRARDCTTTLERGLDAWIAGGDLALGVAGATLGVGLRAHAQHGIALDERSGTSLSFADRARDEGVRAGAGLSLGLLLPRVALWDVVEPRAVVSLDGYRDVLSSHFARRSLRVRDAEPPGDGLEDPLGARRVDGAVIERGGVGLELRADGARASLWGAGSIALGQLTVPAVAGRIEQPIEAGFAAPSGEAGARVRVGEELTVGAVATHVQQGDDPATLLLGPELGTVAPLPARPGGAIFVDDAAELSLAWQGTIVDVDLAVWGAQRAGTLVVGLDPEDAATLGEVPRLVPGPVQIARGVEGRGTLRTGLDGLVARATIGLVDVDDGGLFDARTPTTGVPNPQGTLAAAWDPSTMPFGVLARARFLLPQQRLSTAEQQDPLLCPERPSDDQLAAGVVQDRPCTGAAGAFLFDVGAHLDVGAFRVDALVENLLDQQGALRGEPLGFGGAAGRVLLTLRL
ncbi:MAG: Plug domain-containing protein [Deltaproteobacteria bacterium]|nr:Plug domain-containing protein [Deltaproteobacteria bacterium]